MRTSLTAEHSIASLLVKLVLAESLCLMLLLSGSCTPERPRSGDSRNNISSDSALVIRNAWLRPASEGMTAGGYLTVYNGRPTADTLLGISTSEARSAEIHESYRTEAGLSGMRPAGPLPIRAGSLLELKPGGYHLMLMNLNRDLAEGDSITLSVYFAESDSIMVRVPVKKN